MNKMIDNLIDISRLAGKEILDVYDGSINVTLKDDLSPLTDADRKSNHIITKKLISLYPDIPILSEEGEDVSFSKRKSWKTFWLIDPLDGTIEFIKRNGEFTVNIALIKNHYPVFGSVYAPCMKELFWAYEGLGAWKETNKTKQYKIKILNNSTKKRIVISRSHPNKKVLDFISKYDEYELIRMGSSLKLCCIADGKADIYPRLGPTSEWDIGAAQCIVEKAGGSVLEYDTEARLRYNKENILNPFFIVSA